MVYHLINANYKELFRFLYRIKGKREELRGLFIDGGKSYISNGLNIRKTEYFNLLKGERKTLKDLILAGHLREYPFSRVVRNGFFVPKLKGDILYSAYLMRGFGESVYVDGIEEAEKVF